MHVVHALRAARARRHLAALLRRLDALPRRCDAGDLRDYSCLVDVSELVQHLGVLEHDPRALPLLARLCTHSVLGEETRSIRRLLARSHPTTALALAAAFPELRDCAYRVRSEIPDEPWGGDHLVELICTCGHDLSGAAWEVYLPLVEEECHALAAALTSHPTGRPLWNPWSRATDALLHARSDAVVREALSEVALLAEDAVAAYPAPARAASALRC